MPIQCVTSVCILLSVFLLWLSLLCVFVCIGVRVRVCLWKSVSVCVWVCLYLSTPKIFSGWLVVQLFRLIDGILHAVKQTSTVYRTILDFCWFGLAGLHFHSRVFSLCLCTIGIHSIRTHTCRAAPVRWVWLWVCACIQQVSGSGKQRATWVVNRELCARDIPHRSLMTAWQSSNEIKPLSLSPFSASSSSSSISLFYVKMMLTLQLTHNKQIAPQRAEERVSESTKSKPWVESSWKFVQNFRFGIKRKMYGQDIIVERVLCNVYTHLETWHE